MIPDLRLDEFAQMSPEALVAREVGIASWRANTWTWRPGPARRVGLGFGSARIAADCAHEIGGRLHGTDRVDRDPCPVAGYRRSMLFVIDGKEKRSFLKCDGRKSQVR